MALKSMTSDVGLFPWHGWEQIIAEVVCGDLKNKDWNPAAKDCLLRSQRHPPKCFCFQSMAGQTPQSNTQKHHIIIGQTATIVFCLSECPMHLAPTHHDKDKPLRVSRRSNFEAQKLQWQTSSLSHIRVLWLLIVIMNDCYYYTL